MLSFQVHRQVWSVSRFRTHTLRANFASCITSVGISKTKNAGDPKNDGGSLNFTSSVIFENTYLRLSKQERWLDAAKVLVNQESFIISEPYQIENQIKMFVSRFSCTAKNGVHVHLVTFTCGI